MSFLPHWTFKWWTLPAGPAASAVPAVGPAPGMDIGRGYPHCPLDDLLAPHAQLLARIKLAYGLDRSRFELDLLPLIRRYAAFVHRLPATAHEHFCDDGGLLQLGLDIAFYALQATDGHIFSGGSSITERRQLEPRWRFATFVAGLGAELYRTLSHVVVTDEHGGTWPAYLQTLHAWLEQRHAERFHLDWRPDAQEVRALGVFVLWHILPPEQLQWLAEGNSVIVPQMLASLGGATGYRTDIVLDQLVRRATTLVIDRNLKARTARSGQVSTGSHMARFLVDAIQRLAVTDCSWEINRERSRLWYGQDGLYLVWPGAIEDARRSLEAAQLSGIPPTTERCLDLLLDGGFAVRRPNGEPIWQIRPMRSPHDIEAIRLVVPSVILDMLPAGTAPLAECLCIPDTEPSADATAVPGRDALAPAPVQASLFEHGDARPSDLQAPPRGEAPAIRLLAPLRLVGAVRDALVEIVDSLNREPSAHRCCRVAAGVFVPLSELALCRLDIASAMRTLHDTGLSSGEAKPHCQPFRGGYVPGITIDARHIAGLPPADRPSC